MALSEPPSIESFLAQLDEGAARVFRHGRIAPDDELNEINRQVELLRAWTEGGAAVQETLHGGQGTQYDQVMADVTRAEIEAKLETIDAKMDGRVASIEGKIDTMLARLEGATKANELTYQHIQQSLEEARAHTRGLKAVVVGTAVASVLALAALNATMLANMLASFEAGKSTATALVQTTEQLRRTQEDVKSLADILKLRGMPCKDPSEVRDANGNCVAPVVR